MGTATDKQAMKRLRETRKPDVERARKTIKTQARIIKAIKEQLTDGPKTVVEMARALRMDTAQVLLFVSGLRKYGEVIEGAKDGDYFKYELS